VLLILLLPALVVAAADYDREKRWASEITPGLIVGEPIYLTQKNSHKFFGIYAEADDASVGVVVVHGMGLHPDWGLIGILRQRLFDFGYSTLSIQMPVLAADASYKEYPAVFPEAAERLSLAVSYLKDQGYEHIMVASHSNGSRMSRVYMSENPADVSAWVALSLTQGGTFEGVNAPILDLYGENDLPHVLSSVAKRKNSFMNSASRQVRIPDTDHFFTGHEEAMVEAVREFLGGLK
jgi:pimeloyl-ACP methyl ester carboxylesterase